LCTCAKAAGSEERIASSTYSSSMKTFSCTWRRVSRFLRVEELKSFQRMGGRPAAARLGCDLARDFFARAGFGARGRI
jgi:hypothetical protein